MWEGTVFAEYLEERYADRFGPDVMQNIVVPQMRQGAVHSIKSVQD